MKKKILGGIVVIGMVAIAMLNLNINVTSSEFSPLSMNNVEALADGESGSYIPCVTENGRICFFTCSTPEGTFTCSIDGMIRI